MEPYRSYYPNAGLLLPETERLTDRVLCLPTGSAVDADDIALICGIIRTALENADEVRAFCAAKEGSL
jgi:dTDP-4-amino-4,6-dideoxygalactose transaminase